MKIVKPLVVFDLETTGPWIEKDKIIEIAIIKLHPDGRREEYHKRVNPGIPIPKAVSELTGISDADVAQAPKFKDLAVEIMTFIGECDVAGFNVERFDLPLLERECKEAGYTFVWQNRSIYDAQKVYHLNEKRDLTAAYQHYCCKDLGDNAHAALADAQATFEILEAQVKKYSKGTDELTCLQEFNYKQLSEFYDDDRKFRWWNGELYMMFGKYAKRHSLKEIVKMDRGYLEWILSADFSQTVKDLITNAIEGKFPSQDKSASAEAIKKG